MTLGLEFLLTRSRTQVICQSGFVLKAQQVNVTAASSKSSVFCELAITGHPSSSVQLSTGGKTQSQFVLFKKVAVILFGF